jgi:hypothetical protein
VVAVAELALGGVVAVAELALGGVVAVAELALGGVVALAELTRRATLRVPRRPAETWPPAAAIPMAADGMAFDVLAAGPSPLDSVLFCDRWRWRRRR